MISIYRLCPLWCDYRFSELSGDKASFVLLTDIMLSKVIGFFIHVTVCVTIIISDLRYLFS